MRVDRVLRAPQQMEAIAGREITVRLRSRTEPGTKAVFEAEGWMYGESMAVIETRRRRVPAETPSAAAAEHETESAAAADRATRFRQTLKARADDASSVVVGRVVSVRSAEDAAAVTGRSASASTTPSGRWRPSRSTRRSRVGRRRRSRCSSRRART